MHHFRSSIGLLVIISHRHRIEFANRVISFQNTTWIFPSNGRTCFHLRPRNFRIIAFADSAFRYKIIDTSFSLLIAWIPVLYGRIFYFGIIHDYNFHNSSMQLVFVAHRSSTTFEIRNIRIVVGHNKRSFELPRINGIYTKISRKFHRTANAFWNIHK